MDKEQESKATEEKGNSEGKLGYRLVVGAGLGYLVGRGLLKKPMMGVAVGVALALIIRSSSHDER